MDQVNKNIIKILNWNANSIVHNIHELYDFNIEHSIDIACIQETMYNVNDLTPAHPQYYVYRNDRIVHPQSRQSGGVAIMIRRDINHNLLPIPDLNLIEAIGLEIVLHNQEKIEIWSVYLPGGSHNDEINLHYKRDLLKLTNKSNSFFINGDFNSHHRFWNCTRSNNAGNILYNLHNNSNFFIHHPNSPTRHSSSNNSNSSTIDLTLTNGLHQISDLFTFTSSSDHDIITYSIDVLNAPVFNNARLIPSFKHANWQKFKDIVNTELNLLPMPTLNTIDSETMVDELISKFTSVALQAQKASIPMIRPTPYATVLTNDIKLKIRQRNNYRRQMQRNPTLRSAMSPIINHLTKQIRDDINRIVNLNFNHKLSTITNENNNRALWQTTKFLKNRHNLIPPLKVNNRTLITAEEKTNVLASEFLTNHSNPLENDSVTHTTFVKNTVSRFINNCSTISTDSTNDIEIQQTIKHLKRSKAPGFDMIHNTLLKQLPPIGFTVIALIINSCLKFSYFPSNWKHAKVISIKKPGKPASSPSSYRPISLLSSLSKILEKVILTRLKNHLDDKRIIPSFQHGFRERHSTVTQLNRITEQVNHSLNNGLSTGMVLMDIEKAFDRVWYDGLIFKLISTSTPHYIIKIIHSFLQNRSYQVHLQGKSSETHRIRFGLPQGSCLSPTLYNVYTHDIPAMHDCKIALFADDTALYVSSRFAKKIVNTLQHSCKKMNTYFKKWKIKINESKSQVVFLTNRKSKQIPTEPFKFGSTEINWETSAVKYLGLYIDKRLTFKNHVEYVIYKLNTAVKILYSLINKKSRLNLNSKLLLYKMVIRPMATYAAPIFNTVANCHKKKLQIIQNKTLKLMMNKPWDYPTHLLHEEAKIELMSEYVNKLSDNFNTRQRN